MKLTVAQVIKKLQDAPQDYEVVVMAQEKPINRGEHGNQASGEVYEVDVFDAEKAVYIFGKDY